MTKVLRDSSLGALIKHEVNHFDLYSRYRLYWVNWERNVLKVLFQFWSMYVRIVHSRTSSDTKHWPPSKPYIRTRESVRSFWSRSWKIPPKLWGKPLEFHWNIPIYVEYKIKSSFLVVDGHLVNGAEYQSLPRRYFGHYRHIFFLDYQFLDDWSFVEAKARGFDDGWTFLGVFLNRVSPIHGRHHPLHWVCCYSGYWGIPLQDERVLGALSRRHQDVIDLRLFYVREIFLRLIWVRLCGISLSSVINVGVLRFFGDQPEVT